MSVVPSSFCALFVYFYHGGSLSVGAWQPVDGVTWPAGLEQLLFGRVFNQQIQGTVWASGLRQLALGDFFDQALHGVAWPANLEQLSLGNKFNQVTYGRALFAYVLAMLGGG